MSWLQSFVEQARQNSAERGRSLIERVRINFDPSGADAQGRAERPQPRLRAPRERRLFDWLSRV